MLAALKQICDQNNLSSAHIVFANESQWHEIGEQGFLLRQDKQFWWENRNYPSFDAFLADLSANRRKVIKRERREVHANLQIKTIVGEHISETHMGQMYNFICATYDKKWGAPYLTREFFTQILAVMRDKIVLFFAYDNDEAIAGAINFIGDNVLYGRQWGCLREVPFLHFELCYYQAIEFAIANGIDRVEAGTQGQHKLSRGYLPHPTYSAHYIRDEGLRNAVAAFLEREREAVENHIHDLRENASPFKEEPSL
jgi:predicted N-acyltransferase